MGWAGTRPKPLCTGTSSHITCASNASQRLSSASASAVEVSQQHQTPQYSPAVICSSLSADVRPSGRPVGTARDPPLAKVSGTVAGFAFLWDALVLDSDLTRSIHPICSAGQPETRLFLADLKTAGLARAACVPRPVDNGQEP